MSLSSLLPFVGCALMGVVCFALMHRSGSTPPTPDDTDELRAEVARLRAEVAQLRGDQVDVTDTVTR